MAIPSFVNLVIIFFLTLINRISAFTKLFSAKKAQKITSTLLNGSNTQKKNALLFATR